MRGLLLSYNAALCAATLAQVRTNVLAAYLAGGRAAELPAVMEAMKVGAGAAGMLNWWHDLWGSGRSMEGHRGKGLLARAPQRYALGRVLRALRRLGGAPG